MNEINSGQSSFISTVEQENRRYSQLDGTEGLDDAICKAKLYHQKLVNIKLTMLLTNDRVSRLKRQATKLLEERERKEQEIKQSLRRRELLERHLEPVVNTRQEYQPEY